MAFMNLTYFKNLVLNIFFSVDESNKLSEN